MKRILIIDDAANLRLLYQLELEVEGYEVVAAGSGAEALEVLAQKKIDAVVMDLLLPDCFGLELLNEILSWQRHLPLIINTAYEQFRDNFQTWGADAFVVKSSDLMELKGALGRAISRRGPASQFQPPREKRNPRRKSSPVLPRQLRHQDHGRAGALA
ncbi:MAG: response regulator [candidate division KSB1 bacterium]|nr:response regulator [candidate division KSB1 bacterium]MDZ7367267.1 response regulator [candidate division KSB1 bacterium]MDZ7405894.1 response regulator [candidate division KSB1 bacterium]